MSIEPLERKRVQNINFVMDDLHKSVSSIYEHLMDKEYGLLQPEINELIKKLKSINESIKDEI
jgi:primase-polymerase (primpol)-like protein